MIDMPFVSADVIASFMFQVLLLIWELHDIYTDTMMTLKLTQSGG